MKSFIARLFAACCAFAAGSVLGAPFSAPAEGPVPFRRDRLPLDAESMTALAADLVTLTGALDPATAAARRTAAQLLALSLALDPSNQAARIVLDAFQSGTAQPTNRIKDLERANANVWNSLAWLEDPTAGTDGQALAACLIDVVNVTDSAHSRAKEFAGKPEKGKWSRWVGELASFEKPAPVVAGTPDEVAPDPDPAEPPAQAAATIRLKEAFIQTPLWTYDKEARRSFLQSTSVSMRARQDEPETPAEDSDADGAEEAAEPNPFRIQFDKTEPSAVAAKLSDTLVKALTTLHGPLPENTRIALTIADGADYLTEPNGNSISAAAALLAHAALSGVAPDATVMGVVDESGALRLPYRFWEKLRALEAGPGGRLVLPTAAAPYLPSILALEKSEFFFKYEVLLASNLAELIERSGPATEGPVATASAAFAEIRSRIGTQTVPQYVSNSFIRQRLAAIAQEHPYHASARMLTVQGAGERPTLLPRNILASELRSAIRPMAWIGRDEDSKLIPADLDATYDACRPVVDSLDRYTTRSDRELVETSRSLINSIRTLSRTVRAPAREDDDSNTASRAAAAMQKSYQAVRAELALIAADEEPKPEPPPPAP